MTAAQAPLMCATCVLLWACLDATHCLHAKPATSSSEASCTYPEVLGLGEAMSCLLRL